MSFWRFTTLSSENFLVLTAQRLGADSLFKGHDYSIVSFDHCRIVRTSCKTIRACNRWRCGRCPFISLHVLRAGKYFQDKRNFLFYKLVKRKREGSQ